MTKVRFHPLAEAEMVAAAAYYESQQGNLGKRFLAAVQDAINSITINPRLYPIVDLDVRRCLTKVFPFGVLFRILGGDIVIVAVMHLAHHPDYWKDR
jgi:toxin ParE1/3/4